ncbi:hypothetical protein AFAEC_a0038 (plasmid) [Aliarcobacter faecis]|uniref:Uncharacterized protein n=1 Tax=Aliarcobacter faecis TaxID=1564138 RepID=A0A6M8NC61_9BACT|nr:hypothetical protein AFAEC_a0038 [Aliarcobacter faecis]
MTKTNLINKINELSPEMRIFLEQRLKTHLIEIDNEEYVTNLINSQKLMLEKYHLYILFIYLFLGYLVYNV